MTENRICVYTESGKENITETNDCFKQKGRFEWHEIRKEGLNGTKSERKVCMARNQKGRFEWHEKEQQVVLDFIM